MPVEPTRVLFPIFAIVLTSSPALLPAQPLAPEAIPSPASAARRAGSDCPGGLALDDGSAETGYGWVPSVPDGEYVQRILFGQLPNRRLESVCICWQRTREDADVDFEVVFYEDAGGQPAAEPYSAVPANAQTGQWAGSARPATSGSANPAASRSALQPGRSGHRRRAKRSLRAR